MSSWTIGERIFYPCDQCGTKTSTTMTIRGRKNDSGMCKNCQNQDRKNMDEYRAKMEVKNQ